MFKLKLSGKNIFEKLAPVFLVLTIALAFAVGVLWSKVSSLEKGKEATTQATNVPTQPAVTMDKIKDLFKKDLIKFGDENKKLLLVEVADPSCPYCHVVSGKNPELNRQMDAQTNSFKLTTNGGTYQAPVPEFKKLVDSGKASFVYIYSPGHGNGELAMKALYCANEKGKFWEAQDILMTNKGYDFMNNTVKNDMTKSGLMATFLAKAVDSAFMKECLDSGKYNDRLAADEAIASSIGISGTPGFYINTTNFPGAYSYKDMQSVVNEALK